MLWVTTGFFCVMSVDVLLLCVYTCVCSCTQIDVYKQEKNRKKICALAHFNIISNKQKYKNNKKKYKKIKQQPEPDDEHKKSLFLSIFHFFTCPPCVVHSSYRCCCYSRKTFVYTFIYFVLLLSVAVVLLVPT